MADEVRTAFDPVINQINAMVAEQIAAVTARSKNRRGPKVSEEDMGTLPTVRVLHNALQCCMWANQNKCLVRYFGRGIWQMQIPLLIPQESG